MAFLSLLVFISLGGVLIYLYVSGETKPDSTYKAGTYEYVVNLQPINMNDSPTMEDINKNIGMVADPQSYGSINVGSSVEENDSLKKQADDFREAWNKSVSTCPSFRTPIFESETEQPKKKSNKKKSKKSKSKKKKK